MSLLRSPRLHLFDRKHNNTMKYYYNFKEVFSIVIYSKMSSIPVIVIIITPAVSVT